MSADPCCCATPSPACRGRHGSGGPARTSGPCHESYATAPIPRRTPRCGSAISSRRKSPHIPGYRPGEVGHGARLPHRRASSSRSPRWTSCARTPSISCASSRVRVVDRRDSQRVGADRDRGLAADLRQEHLEKHSGQIDRNLAAWRAGRNLAAIAREGLRFDLAILSISQSIGQSEQSVIRRIE